MAKVEPRADRSFCAPFVALRRWGPRPATTSADKLYLAKIGHMFYICSIGLEEGGSRLSGSAEAEWEFPPAVRRRDQSMAARRAARLKKVEREMRIVRCLNDGLTTREIADREGLTHRRMRAVVQEILEKRLPPPPPEFSALQVGRLNGALDVSYGAMSGANLRAVELVVRIVRQLDRYHDLSARGLPRKGSAGNAATSD